MNKLYVIKDGIENVGTVMNKNGERLRNTNYYVLSYDYISNVGYIEKKNEQLWKLYTSVGSSNDFKSRYHYFFSFEKCIEVLQKLCNTETEIIICNEEEINLLKNTPNVKIKKEI